jgi:kynurenine formamidase
MSSLEGDFMILSHFINNSTPVYGNREMINITTDSSIAEGGSCNSLNLNFKNHVGTHIDLPKHFDNDGKTLSDYEDEDWVFKKCQLINVSLEKNELLRISHLENLIDRDTELLLIKTGFESYRGQTEYWNNNPGIHPEVGTYLRNEYPALNTMGFDLISITAYQFRDLGKEAHKSLLSSTLSGEPLRVIEDMKLSIIDHSPSEVIVAPLMIESSDGVPVTVVAK